MRSKFPTNMRLNKNIIVCGLLIAVIYLGLPYLQQHPEIINVHNINIPAEKDKTVKHPKAPNITETIIPHKSYRQVMDQMKAWETIAPELTDVNVYGRSTRGSDLTYIRLTNELNKNNKDKILCHFCIHGNEPLATSVGMSYIANILHDYGTKEIQDLLDKYEIYFVPVTSPDSFPNSRYVDGVDPNRDFAGPSDKNHKPTKSIKALQDLFLMLKPVAAFSGHTSGRWVIVPWGYTNSVTKNDAVYKEVAGKIANLNQYKLIRGCELYGNPIKGTEIDFYYMNDAFAVLFEFGTHQHIPSIADTNYEFERTWKGFKYFLKNADCLKKGK